MMELLIYCLIAGCIGSLLQGLIGIGTGIIIVPFLSWILPKYGFTPNDALHIALATSMAAITINSISALVGHYKLDNIDWQISKKMIIFSAFGAMTGAAMASFVSWQYLTIFYGVFLLYVAIQMFMKSSREYSHDEAFPLSRKKLALGGLGIGFMSSLIGSGGTILMIPFFRAHKLNMRHCVGTATLIGLPIAMMGALTYELMSKGMIHWPSLLSFSVVGLVGAPIGVKLSAILPAKLIQRIFALLVSVIGLKMIMSV